MIKPIKVAVVGMGFGSEFVPIYQAHPNVSSVAIVDVDPQVLEQTSNKFNIHETFTSLDSVLNDPSFDAVHIVSPINHHASQSIAVLDSGKHCACTIPMGLSFEEIADIIKAKQRSGKKYMMMETAVYTREYLFVKDLFEKGELGQIQYMRCAHYQDMEYWPQYWAGFPPLMHPTHAVAPCIALSGKLPRKVFGLGSGSMRQQLVQNYNNPFPFEAAFIWADDNKVCIEMERFMFEVARDYSENFNVYGSKQSFEWQQIENEMPVLYRFGQYDGRRGLPTISERIETPDYAHLLPEPLQKFTKSFEFVSDRNSNTYLAGGGHGGSHPHLVNEFVQSIIEDRKPAIDEVTAAYWTGVGICAHISAMQGGAVINVPHFENY